MRRKLAARRTAESNWCSGSGRGLFIEGATSLNCGKAVLRSGALYGRVWAVTRENEARSPAAEEMLDILREVCRTYRDDRDLLLAA